MARFFVDKGKIAEIKDLPLQNGLVNVKKYEYVLLSIMSIWAFVFFGDGLCAFNAIENTLYDPRLIFLILWVLLIPMANLALLTAKFEKRKFDPVESGAEFDKNYEENLAFVKANLPEEILCDIKDLRVLALGSVTYGMAARITRFCGQINNRCEATRRKYEEATDDVVDRMGGCIPPLFRELEGAPISSVVCDDGYAIVTTSHEYTGTAVKVTLTNPTLMELEDGIEGAMIHKYELLPYGESGIEFSLLAIKEDSSLLTLAFAADSIEIEEII